MKLAVIGMGHVGLVTAASLASIGHEVVGVDEEPARIETLNAGRMPFFEQGLAQLVWAGQSSGRLRFTCAVADAVSNAEVAFICVGTPGRPNGESNLVAVELAATAVGRSAARPMVVVEKSTVPMQTADRIRAVLNRTARHDFDIASNPEFLREGRAVEDSLRPARILVGADSRRAHDVMVQVYAPQVAEGAPYYATDLRTAELAKHACNAFLALKVSFSNGLARVCEAAGADVVSIADIMGSDPRIGRDFLDAGLGYGGSCFPKDLAAFRAQTERLGYHFGLLEEIVRLNDEALSTAFQKVRDAVWNLEGKRILLLGLAFKPGTDDVRESPALRLARLLVGAEAHVVGYDPRASAAAKEEMPEMEVVEDPYAGAEGAHCLVVCTEWPEFKNLDLAGLKGTMTVPILVDCRNVFDPDAVAQAGFTYIPTGRPGVNR
jgi:UDPglucose 6-dehydrogenase